MYSHTHTCTHTHRYIMQHFGAVPMFLAAAAVAGTLLVLRIAAMLIAASTRRSGPKPTPAKPRLSTAPTDTLAEV